MLPGNAGDDAAQLQCGARCASSARRGPEPDSGAVAAGQQAIDVLLDSSLLDQDTEPLPGESFTSSGCRGDCWTPTLIERGLRRPLAATPVAIHVPVEGDRQADLLG